MKMKSTENRNNRQNRQESKKARLEDEVHRATKLNRSLCEALKDRILLYALLNGARSAVIENIFALRSGAKMVDACLILGTRNIGQDALDVNNELET